jgi:hypothetical protein
MVEARESGSWSQGGTAQNRSQDCRARTAQPDPLSGLLTKRQIE